MKKYIFIIVLIFPFIFIHCNKKSSENKKNDDNIISYQLPKVLFLTTGTDEGYGKLAQGIIIAIQSFNRKGAILEIKSRDILKYPEELSNYNFLILSTALGYHDADKQYSLSFMSDFEIENIRNFVKEGGVLIAGDNVGRNKPDGNDRISLYGQLTPANWGLSSCFGVSMQEINMKDYSMNGNMDSNLNGEFKAFSETDLWILVGDSIHSTELIELARWENDTNHYPAMIQNNYGKGIAFLLPSSYFLHPSNDGGYWSAYQIQSFYDLTIDAFNKKNNNKISLNPWPNGYEQAFCLSLNANGSLKEFKRVEKFLKQQAIAATYFVNGQLNNETRDLLAKTDIQSNGFAQLKYQKNLYPASKDDIIENEISWNRQFIGFRFPYTRPSFWGITALEELGYSYESSFGADNIENFIGSVFPYQIPISFNSYYKTTRLLEISPTYHDDYYYFKDILKSKIYPANQQAKDAQLFSKYLTNYWEYAVKPYHGLMVFMGHPGYVGYSDTTLSALPALIAKVKEDKSWITTMDQVASYWNNLNSMTFEVTQKKKNTLVKVQSSGNNNIENLCLNMDTKPVNVKVKSGKEEVVEKGGYYQLIFNAHNGQELEFSFE